MIVVAILISEVAFWLFLVSGLAARYVLGRPRLGMVLLLGSPAADLNLLALTAIDLDSGAEPTGAHALAATYLGFSVVFGPSVVTWADRRFANRATGGPAPVRPQRSAEQRVRHEWSEFRKAVLSWAIAGGLLIVLSAIVGDVQRAEPLLRHVGVLTVVLGIWFVTGPVAASIGAGRGDRPPGDGSGDGEERLPRGMAVAQRGGDERRA